MKDRGVLAALAAAVLFGLSTPLAQRLLAGMPPQLLAGLLYLGSGGGLALWVGLRRLTTGERIPWPRGGSLGWLLAATVFGGAVAPYLLMRGLEVTDSATASLTLNLEGVFTTLLAWFVFKENFDRRILGGMALILLGGALLSVRSFTHFSTLLGPALIAVACLSWGIDNNLTRKVSTDDALLIACAKGLIAGAVNTVLALRFGAHLPAAPLITAAALLGFLGYGVSLTLFVVALRQLGTARTGAYFSLAPFLGAALAVVLGAPFTPALAVAGLCMLAGVWLHLSEHHEHWHRHERLVHEHPHMHDAHHLHAHDREWPDGEPHSHAHVHEPLEHAHAHYPDVHHRHPH